LGDVRPCPSLVDRADGARLDRSEEALHTRSHAPSRRKRRAPSAAENRALVAQVAFRDCRPDPDPIVSPLTGVGTANPSSDARANQPVAVNFLANGVGGAELGEQGFLMGIEIPVLVKGMEKVPLAR